MKIELIAQTKGGQDGAIFGKYLFRFNHNGGGHVYDMEAIAASSGGSYEPFATFTLDKAELIAPHSNAVVFGNEYFAEGDEFPLLYSNIYNNYAKSDEPLKGVCCVYRLWREGEEFKTTLVQLIEIGFVENAELWKATPEKDGVRPYGNFVIDADKGVYYAFVMRNEERGMAYFAFDLPSLADGKFDEKYGVNRVVLNAEDIKKSFACPEHYYIQGACCHGGLIYSTGGFRNSPSLSVIDPEKGERIFCAKLPDYGMIEEAEFIDFYNGNCYYGDCRGEIYLIEF